jgi:cytosine/adenosine deaminase-related metal-dependent hydrolase
MVAKMTARTADLFDLRVGRLAVGWPADLLVLDPSRLDDGPEWGRSSPTAVRHSYIAGEPVVADGRWLSRRLQGAALRGGSGR